MTTGLGRNVRLEIGATYGSPKTVTAITLANPGVATSATHAMANGDVGYWTTTGGGMPQIEGQATRVANQATNTFELQSLPTTSYTAWVTGGTFTPVATWTTISEAIGYSYGGGSQDLLDDTKLSSVTKQEIIGLLPADTVQIDVLSPTYNSTAFTALDVAAIAGTDLVFRITMQDSSVRVFRGVPSRAGESLQRGQLATGSFQVAVKGLVLKGAA
jgi:hypothetical protein